MDPDENLREQLDLARGIANGDQGATDPDRLAELVLAMHEWLVNGGFLPADWTARW